MWHDLRRSIVDLDADDEVRVIVFTGSGDEVFSASAEISQFESHRRAAQASTNRDDQGRLRLGGGSSSPPRTTFVTARTRPFRVPIARLGLPIAFAEVCHVTRPIDYTKTVELLLTADLLPTDELLRIGLLNHVVSLADV